MQLTEHGGKGIKKAGSFLLKDIPKDTFNVINRHINKRGTNECQPSKQKAVVVFILTDDTMGSKIPMLSIYLKILNQVKIEIK